ncbi:MAG: tellurite resistance TerB family protein [Pelagimonas sp.]|uniref:tellurite resistance TerB family protein n=1 Tax=Pelagimonas sp. TaxID=2073170 RepID=UPI003D6B2206
MGLMGTLAKVAIGYAAARGVDKLSGSGLLGGGAQVKGQEPTSEMQAQMGQMLSGHMPEGAGNPMQDMMAKFQENGLGAMMGGEGNPMADMMEKMKGGLDMSALMGGGSSGQGGLLSSLGGGAGLAGMLAAAGAATQGQGMAGLLDSLNVKENAPQADEAAGLMLRAMIQAAKCDGDIDEAKKAKLLETIGDDADADDIAFVQAQFTAAVDPEALAKDTPEEQRMQVYSASLMTIRVDTAAEAQYLDRLAKAMALNEGTVNTLHMQMGLQPLYN